MNVDDFLDQTIEQPECWPTGLTALDKLTGGFRRGQLWVITGAPSSGKSMLLTQLVFTLAVKHGFSTSYFCARIDPQELTRARLLSLAVTMAPQLPDLTVPLDGLSQTQQAGLDSLRRADLEVHGGGGFGIPRPDIDDGAKRCLAIDDPEARLNPIEHHETLRTIREDLARLSESGHIVLVTVPRGRCVERLDVGERLREEWSAVADIVIEVVPGEFGSDSLRLWQNRRGPQPDLAVTGMAHLAKFVDRAS